MTTRQVIARILSWLLDRVEPPEPTAEVVSAPLTWPPESIMYTTWTCPHCGEPVPFNGTHACWSAYGPPSWPNNDITFTVNNETGVLA